MCAAASSPCTPGILGGSPSLLSSRAAPCLPPRVGEDEPVRTRLSKCETHTEWIAWSLVGRLSSISRVAPVLSAQMPAKFASISRVTASRFTKCVRAPLCVAHDFLRPSRSRFILCPKGFSISAPISSTERKIIARTKEPAGVPCCKSSTNANGVCNTLQRGLTSGQHYEKRTINSVVGQPAEHVKILTIPRKTTRINLIT